MVVIMQPHFNESHIQLLIHAFEHDPMIVKLFKGKHKQQQLRSFFRFIYVRNTLMSGIFLTDNNEHPSYVAFIEIPRHKRKFLLVKMLQLYVEMIKLAHYIPLRYLRFLSIYDRITIKHRPRENHYYLTMLAVASHKQGQGIGKNVLNLIHKIVHEDDETSRICLDTQNKDNVNFYERLGYTLTQAVKVKDLVIYCMMWSKNN